MSLDPSYDLVTGDFFVLRSPLLPFDELTRWSEGLEAPAAGATDRPLADAVAADRQRLRARLGEILERPEVREALHVASRSLASGLEAWRRDPDSRKARRAEDALVRYLQRMASRPTPFGLFSGCTVGTVGETTALHLAERAAYQRFTRLDSDYLCQLCEELVRAPELRRRLRYRVTSSIYRIGGRLRYAESVLQGRARTHHLVDVASEPHLERALELAERGVTWDRLVAALVELEPEAGVSEDEAGEYLVELIDAQILIPDLEPAITGGAPLDGVIERLDAVDPAGPARVVLASVRERLAELDRLPIGSDLDAYDRIAVELDRLPPQVEPSRLLQVDLMKPGAASLGPAVIAEIERGVRLLHRLGGDVRHGELEAFRRAFRDRWEEGEEVPLVEALDAELGPGLGGTDAGGDDPAPLIDGLAIPLPSPAGAAGAGGSAAAPTDALLLAKAETALREHRLEIEITEDDLAPLPHRASPLPDALMVKAALAARSEAALAEGDFELALYFASGPSGAQMLGRFCYAEPALESGVRRHLRREEALDGDAIFAEVIHLPEGRMGNVLVRPVLRGYEIPFLGRSGADDDHQIPVSDLLVSVAGDRIVLRSKRLGRRVVPRLTSAHNFSGRSLAVYRFLCTLQSQDCCGGLRWSWGGLDGLSFVPRVRSGRIVLSRARWRVSREEIAGLYDSDPANRFAAAQRWRDSRDLPRRVLLADGDNELLVDLDNSLSLDAFAGTVRKRPRFELVELFPNTGNLCAAGPEGRFVHELLVPFTLRTTTRPRPQAAVTAPAVRRSFPPGSEWLFAKLYTGTATADRVLVDPIRPLVRELSAAGAIDRWFFLRYADPHPHLRLRFHGEPAALLGGVFPALRDVVATLLDAGLAWRFQIQDYRREVERYGGAAGIGLAERLFHHDSEAVVEALAALPRDATEDARWKLALVGTDLWLSDLASETVGRTELLAELERGWANEFRVGASAVLRKQLAAKLREHREALADLLFAPLPADHSLAPAIAALRLRSERVRPVVAELRTRERSGTLSSPVSAMAGSYVHMFNNRLFRSRGRPHEMVLTDFLERLHRSRAVRRGNAPPREAATGGGR